MGVTRPNVIRLYSDFECRQVDLSRQLGGKLTSPDVEKNRYEVDFKATWTINEEIQTEERNHARFSIYMWYGACAHVACRLQC